jgi:hypothetical protein
MKKRIFNGETKEIHIRWLNVLAVRIVLILLRVDKAESEERE